MRIYITPTFLESLEPLSRKDRKSIQDTLEKLAEDHRNKSLHMHDLSGEGCDETFRTVRSSLDLRIVLSHQSDHLVLLHADHHDDAYAWARGKRLEIASHGALFLYDQIKVEERVAVARENQMAEYQPPGILELQGVTVKDLEKLGIPESHADLLCGICDDTEFMAFIEIYPEEIGEVLIDLATGSLDVTGAYAKLHEEETQVVEAIDHPQARRRFALLVPGTIPRALLEGDFEAWQLFLHPDQRALVEKTHSGPILVEGGPGTGKTVVALHRAVHLARTYPEDQVVLCSFSIKLARQMAEKIKRLCDGEVADRIVVLSADEVIRGALREYCNQVVPTVSLKRVQEIFVEGAKVCGLSLSLSKAKDEYRVMVQQRGYTKEVDYLTADRSGRGFRLSLRQRQELWQLFKWIDEEKKRLHVADWDDLASLLLTSGVRSCYPHMIIDEAQDLSLVRLRALARLVQEGSDNLMILADQNQRIFQMKSWKQETGIPVAGRTVHLGLNYRTTKEIHAFAYGYFGNSDKERLSHNGYKSILTGPEPRVVHFETYKEQMDTFVAEIRTLQEEGVPLHDIALITSEHKSHALGVLYYHGIPYTDLVDDIYPKPNGTLNVVTIEGAKGLEFRHVFITDSQGAGYYLKGPESRVAHQIACRKYVAVTRAREGVVVGVVEDGEN